MTLIEMRDRDGKRAATRDSDMEGGAHAHPGPMEYVTIGIILAIITGIEVAVYYIEALEDALVPIFIALSLSKFILVVLWFMHLKFDSRLFTWLFAGGVMLAVSVFVVVLATFGASLT